MQIEWMVTPDMRAEMEPLLSDALRMIGPYWIHTLTVRYDPGEGDLLSVSVLPEYRTASIRVGNGWFSETQTERRVSIFHEIVHTYIESLAVVFNDLVKATENEETPLGEWAKEQWRRAEEAVVCDLSRRLSEHVRVKGAGQQ